MKTVMNNLESKCNSCGKDYCDTNLLIGVYKQNVKEGIIVSKKELVFLCPECFNDLNSSVVGKGIKKEGENIKPLKGGSVGT